MIHTFKGISNFRCQISRRLLLEIWNLELEIMHTNSIVYQFFYNYTYW
jgi:hypothetical protein